MKLTKLKFGGIGRFSGDFEVPIDQLNGSNLVAIVGENGAGKTTALECLPGAFYRTTPSRGPIAAMANRKDSFLEVGVEINEQPLTARIHIDGVSRQPKTEAYLINGTGEPLTSGKVRDFISEVSKRLPAPEVFLSSAFAAQNGEGRFLDLPPAKRKELFAKLLGLADLQELSTRASVRSKSCELDIAGLRAKADTYREQADTITSVESRLMTANDTLQSATESRERAERRIEESRRLLDDWRQKSDDLKQEMFVAAAAAKTARMEKQHCDEKFAALTRQAEQTKQRIAASKNSLHERNELTALVSLGEIAAERIAEIKEAATQSAVKEKHFSELHRRSESIEREIENAEQQRKRLDEVPCARQTISECCPLISDAISANNSLPDLRRSLNEVREELEKLPPPEPVDDPEPFRSALVKAAAAKVRLGRLDEISVEIDSLSERLSNEEKKIAAAQEELERVRHDDTTTQRAASAARQAVLRHDDSKPKSFDEAELRQLRSSVSWATTEVAKLAHILESAKCAAEKLSGIENEIENASAHFDDWKHLSTALGKNGIQALEIDNASPEVSHLTNELLHACYGSRFSVSLETTRLKADGKGTKEVIELRVIDTERGTEGPADQLSGGEQVLISEALSLAIAIYNARQSSIPMLDLFRDECAGALSPANSIRYIEMLRKALEIGGFHRCYFVAHQPQLWDLADSKLVFADGECRLEDAA